jgi:hypothetical protein
MATNNDIDTQCAKIREMLNDPMYRNHSDIEKALGIKRAAYYRRLAKVQEEDKADSLTKREIRQNSIGADSVTRITNAMENVSNITYEIANNKKEKARDRIAASQMNLAVEIWIYQASNYGKTDGLPKFFDFKTKSLDLNDKDFEV